MSTEPAQPVEIRTESIRLDQFLKWAGIAQTGGHAKILILDGAVRVNGEVEVRRGRALRTGEMVEVEEIGRFEVIGKTS